MACSFPTWGDIQPVGRGTPLPASGYRHAPSQRRSGGGGRPLVPEPAGAATSYERPARRIAGHRRALGVALDEPAQDGRRVNDVAPAGLRLEPARLLGFEVAGVLVDVDPGAQASHVQLGMELGGVDVGTDPERLHRAGG